MKINVGSGTKHLSGYTNTDIDWAVDPDYVTSASALHFCEDFQADEVRMDAVYEHLYTPERKRALKEWFRCLRPGGKLVINWIPDFEAAADLYLSYAQGPTGDFPFWNLDMIERVTHGIRSENPFMLHKSLFTVKSVKEEVEAAGFVIDSIENRVYPGERGYPYNICVEAHKP